MVRIEHLLLHKGDANNVLSTAIAYRSVPRYGYCVSCTMPCGLYHDTPVHLLSFRPYSRHNLDTVKRMLKGLALGQFIKTFPIIL